MRARLDELEDDRFHHELKAEEARVKYELLKPDNGAVRPCERIRRASVASADMSRPQKYQL